MEKKKKRIEVKPNVYNKEKKKKKNKEIITGMQ